MLVLVTLLFAAMACSSDSTNIYRQEAAALCDVFNPKYWRDQTQKMTPSELQEQLSARMKAAVKTEEMRAILRSLSSAPDNKRYLIYTTKVSKLIKQDHHCPAIEDYFSF